MHIEKSSGKQRVLKMIQSYCSCGHELQTFERNCQLPFPRGPHLV